MATCNQRTTEAPSAMITTDRIEVAAVPGMAVGADPYRRSVLITADIDNTADVFVLAGGAQSYRQGYRLTPGSGLTLATAAAVYVVTPAGAAVAYVVTESGEIG